MHCLEALAFRWELRLRAELVGPPTGEAAASSTEEKTLIVNVELDIKCSTNSLYCDFKYSWIKAQVIKQTYVAVSYDSMLPAILQHPLW